MQFTVRRAGGDNTRNSKLQVPRMTDLLLSKPRTILRLASLAAFLGLGCQTTPTHQDPFVIPRQQFLDSVNTVVVASVAVVGQLSVSDSTLELVERLIEERMSDAGFSVVPASEYVAIWDRIAGSAGGFFDPYTGERDEERFEAAASLLRDEIMERFKPDALLYPEIWEVEVPFTHGDARWGGMSQLVEGARVYSGNALAASLFVVVQDTLGNELYVKEAGIQLLERMELGEMTPIPDEEVFSDTTWVKAAVQMALDQLVAKPEQVPR